MIRVIDEETNEIVFECGERETGRTFTLDLEARRNAVQTITLTANAPTGIHVVGTYVTNTAGTTYYIQRERLGR